MSITVCFCYEQIPTMTSLPSTLTAKKIHEVKIFGRQDILQFFSGISKELQMCEIPKHEIGIVNMASKRKHNIIPYKGKSDVVHWGHHCLLLPALVSRRIENRMMLMMVLMIMLMLTTMTLSLFSGHGWSTLIGC